MNLRTDHTNTRICRSGSNYILPFLEIGDIVVSLILVGRLTVFLHYEVLWKTQELFSRVVRSDIEYVSNLSTFCTYVRVSDHLIIINPSLAFYSMCF